METVEEGRWEEGREEVGTRFVQPNTSQIRPRPKRSSDNNACEIRLQMASGGAEMLRRACTQLRPRSVHLSGEVVA
eukprot:6190694-Pleurochrysis_carterae.AAC.1